MTGQAEPADPLDAVVVLPLPGVPEVTERDDLPSLLREALHRAGAELCDGDVIVVSSKVVSKAGGLRTPVRDGDDASRREQLVREQSTRVVAERVSPGGVTQVVASRAGPVLAGAGLDASNTGPQGGVLALPADPDLSARTLYAGLLAAFAPRALPRIAVVISDTAGRPWREGQVDIAIGACGLEVVHDLRGSPDADGRALWVTERAVADEIAAAADLVKGKDAAVPAALVRGVADLVSSPGAAGARALLRSPERDWFRQGHREAVRTALGAPPGSPEASEVGIPATGDEPNEARLSRAIALALLHCDPPVPPEAVHRHPGRLEVRVHEDYQRGLVVARLQVALHAEELYDWTVEPVSAPEGAPGRASAERGADG